MARFLRVVLLLGALTALLSAPSLTAVAAKAPQGSGKVFQNQFSATACGWSVVPSPNPNSPSGLSGVAAVAANDVWAVGGSGSQAGIRQTLIEHWDGAQWQIVPSPNPSAQYNTLYSVSAVAGSDVWAVGYDANPSQVTQTLIEHWNGTQWRVVPSPSPGAVNNELFSVVAVSARDVWAVGFTTNSALAQTTLIEHWNGARWSVVPSPSPGANDVLSGVTAVAASDVWAVGASNTLSQTLIEHWNGTQWQVVPSPSPGTGGVLSGVAAVAAGDVWAVGYYATGGASQTLVEHWNGARWQVAASPNVGTGMNLLNGVAAVAAKDIWAVGSSLGSRGFQTLTEQWNGRQWSVVPSPSPGLSQLAGVAAVAANDVGAVGYHAARVGAPSTTLVEYYHC
jgi:erythromycin esterase-like protein